MIALIAISIIIGIVVSSVTGFVILGLVVGGFIFLCGLPGALLISFVHGEVSYAQDRADMRQYRSDFIAQEIAEDREYGDDERMEMLVDTMKNTHTNINYDNRQVHIHGRV